MLAFFMFAFSVTALLLLVATVKLDIHYRKTTGRGMTWNNFFDFDTPAVTDVVCTQIKSKRGSNVDISV